MVVLEESDRSTTHIVKRSGFPVDIEDIDGLDDANLVNPTTSLPAQSAVLV